MTATYEFDHRPGVHEPPNIRQFFTFHLILSKQLAAVIKQGDEAEHADIQIRQVALVGITR